MEPRTASALLATLAALALTMGGVALVVRARSLAKSLLVSGFALAGGAALAPGLMVSARGISPFDVMAMASAAAGLPALASGKSRLGLSLIWPAVSRYALWPVLSPYLWANWALVLLIVAPFTAFILIWFLQKILTPIYGDRAAGHVVGEYLVRALDGAGRVLCLVIAAPFRLILWILGLTRSLFLARGGPD